IALAVQVGGDGAGKTVPLFSRRPLNLDQPISSMHRATEGEITFDVPEMRKHGFPVPSVSAQSLPPIIILRRAPRNDLSVNRRAAAHDPRLLIRCPYLTAIVSPRQQRRGSAPDVVAVHRGTPG